MRNICTYLKICANFFWFSDTSQEASFKLEHQECLARLERLPLD